LVTAAGGLLASYGGVEDAVVMVLVLAASTFAVDVAAAGTTGV
jgi:hypothetical protein